MKDLPVFIAHPLVKGGHLQTLGGHFLRQYRKIPGAERKILVLDDGDELLLQFYERDSDTVVYLFHGLGGSTDAGYMRLSARAAMSLGHSVFLVNHRGAGEGTHLQHKQPYHSGRAEDLSAVLEYGKNLFPRKKHIAIGYSLSANALLLLLGGQRGSVQPDAAMAFNGPIHLENCSQLLTRGWNKIYDLTFLRDCKTDIKKKAQRGWIKKSNEMMAAKTLRELDELYTAPLGGFRSREEVTTTDDPFVDVNDYRAAKLSSKVKLEILESGGHMGFVNAGRSWLERALVRGIKALEDQIGVSGR